MDDCIRIAKDVFEKEICALHVVKDDIDETFALMLDEIMKCHGKVIFIGMGKSGHIAKKIAATMASLGICSISLHPAECMHGDLGMIQKTDVVVLISYSGESDEIIRIIPGINTIGAVILGITGNGESSLAKACKVVQVIKVKEEACHLGLAPTSSTTAVLVYGDALSVAASTLTGFSKRDFGVFHPAGSLGKTLTTRSVHLMHEMKASSIITESITLLECIKVMLDANSDILAVTGENGRLKGIVTNGDLDKKITGEHLTLNTPIKNIVHFHPLFVDGASLAADALEVMENAGVHSLIVVKDDRPIGTIYRQEIIKYGIQLGGGTR